MRPDRRIVFVPIARSSSLVGAALGLACQPGLAQDAWWNKSFQNDKSAPAAREAPVVIHRWHTIVIPVPLAPTSPAPAAQSAIALAGPHKPAAAPTRPLTGYAHEMSGLASYYDETQGTSSGESFDKAAFTAAHKTLPLGTHVRVTNLANGMSTIVRINDRGPFAPGRVIDLSEAAAKAISMTAAGIARVALEVVR